MTRTLLVAPRQRGAYPTITEALAAHADATRGLSEQERAQATIALAPGTYTEAMLVTHAQVRLVAAEGPDTVTIDATSIAYPVIRCHDGGLTLENLTLRAGDFPAVDAARATLTIERCTLSAGYGPGVAVVGGTLSLARCAISGAEYGIVVEEASGVIEECTITDIAADGLIIRLGADPTVRSCTIHGCGRRGIYIYQYGRPTVEGCDVARTGDAGIAVGYESAPVIRRTWVHDTQGVGVSVGRGCAGSVEECRVENTAVPPIDIDEGATTTVREAPAGAAPARTGPGATGSEGDPMDELLAQLDAMVGLAAVKAEVRSLIDEIQVNEWRRSEGLSISPMSHHLIFAGAPGTGKTSVARLYGKLLSALRVLPKDHLHEVSRRDLVGQYIGHTAEKTATVFEAARGGVLFVDEAYTLARGGGAGGADFGQEAIDTLVKLMEDHRHEIAIIAAGYTQEMSSFLAVNPGLASRFSRTIEFPNYTADELVLILTRMAAADDYLCQPELEPVLAAHFATMLTDEHFGNAREARKLFEGMRTAQAQRLRKLDRRPTVDDLRLLSTEDLTVAVRHAAPASR